jgi:hypothetical protein
VSRFTARLNASQFYEKEETDCGLAEGFEPSA